MESEELITAPGGKLRLLLGFLLVFVLGFSSGYAYSDGRKSSAVLTLRDGSADCADLLEKVPAGAEAAEGTIGGEGAAPKAGAVLGAKTEETPSVTAVSGAFASSKNSNLYHTRDCPYVKRIKAENLVWFASAAEAGKAGRKPHKCAGG